MDKKQYQEFLKSIKQCQKRSQRTLNNVEATLSGVKNTLKDIRQTNQNIDKIKEEYNNVMNKLAQKVARSFINTDQPFKKQQGVNYKDLPTQIPQIQVISKLLKHKKVLIMTGAGVSVDSGIPTFRGKSGLYSKKFEFDGKQLTPEEFITFRNYKQNPEGIWRWIDEIHTLAEMARPNLIHEEIHKLALNLASKGLEIVVVTQNIDDLHIKPKKNQYNYYAIHGNCKLVRCPNHHFLSYTKQRKNELCKQCKQPYRPHVLFFDESYGLNYGGEIKDKDFQFVITIGSSLKTGLAINMIQRAEEVVEINPEPVIEFGKVYHFTQNTCEVLKSLNRALIS